MVTLSRRALDAASNRRLTFRVCDRDISCMVNCGITQESPKAPSYSRHLEELDVAMGGDLIVLPITIGEKAYPFMLAANADRTVVDVRLRKQLGKSLGKKDGADDFAQSEEFAPIPMKVGTLEFIARKPLQCANLE